MTKKVVWTSCNRLSCANVSPAPAVVLCLTDPTLLAPITCQDSSTYQPTTLEATLTRSWKSYDACAATQWSFVFEYDENELTDPATALTSAQISGAVCKGCMHTWVEDEIRRILCAG